MIPTTQKENTHEKKHCREFQMDVNALAEQHQRSEASIERTLSHEDSKDSFERGLSVFNLGS